QLLAESDQGPVRQRELMAIVIGQTVTDEQPVGGSPAHLLVRAIGRVELTKRVNSLAYSLRKEADATVLRGLLLLEQGDADEAEVAFRLALAVWQDAAVAAAGAGLDFDGRPVAEGCLRWLQQ